MKKLLVVIVALGILAGLLGCTTNQSPVLSFSNSPENPKVDEEVTFDASESSDPDGEITSWEWSFGDGNTGTGIIAKHSYQATGHYKVTLKAMDNKGASLEKVKFITISVSETEIAKVKEWAIKVLIETRIILDILPRIGNVMTDLMGTKITQDEAYHTVEEVNNDISQILARVKAMPIPISVEYSATLEEIQALLVESLEADLAGLESVSLAISCFPPDGGMPLNVEESTYHLEEATMNRIKASEYRDKALEKLEKIGLKIAGLE